MITLPKFEAKTATQKSDVDVVFVSQDAGKKPISPKGPYSGSVDKLRKSSAFAAKLGQIAFVSLGGKGSATHAAFVGVGLASELTAEKVRQAAGHLHARLTAEKIGSVQVLVDTLLGLKGVTDASGLPGAFAEGFALSAYKFDKYKKDGKPSEVYGPAKVGFVSKDKGMKAELAGMLKDALVTAECVSVTRDWSNEPANHGTPEYFAREGSRLAKEYGISVKVLGEKEILKEKMTLFLAVGQGSERENKLLIVDYHPKGAEKTIALVGKGITFDSGGISIKPSMKMEDMKHDMTGAATMMGAVLLAARRKVKNRVVAVMAFAENMPDGNAVVPSSVVMTRAGKTVEIINTDAEGRLILADALDYAQDFKPDVIVNAATLTGACGIALGRHCAGLMSNDPELAAEIFRLGNEMHERVWELPLYEEYFEDLKSDYADMKNSANDGMGGTIRGGMFLKQFIRKGVPWAHLDIAYTAQNMGQIPYLPKKGASGMHVRMLAKFAAEF
ncbi:MAG: leucyl aminopeptidase [Bdellovibrionales bacterium]|nr:leucyl aminopeptidase [Bdellovibrionales bacterium]